MDRLKFTLDWNCVIAVETGEPSGKEILELVEEHQRGRCHVALLDVSASENLHGSRLFPGNFRAFEDRILAVKLGHLPRATAQATIGMTYIGRSVIAPPDGGAALLDQLWRIIAPGVNRLDAKSTRSEEELWSEQFKAWRNAWCDVHSAYSHIRSRADYFVTLNIKHFQRHSAQLIPLGLDAVTPAQALEHVAQKLTR